METFILVLHVVIALAIIGLIMLQQGKGAEMGASLVPAHRKPSLVRLAAAICFLV